MSRVAVVLGAYGLVGSACVRVLKQSGFEVVGVGRSRRLCTRSSLDITWRVLDVTTATHEHWTDLTASADVVVNATGALQDGPADDLEAIHVDTVRAAAHAAEVAGARFIQISAAGADAKASTAFFRTKARGEAIIKQMDADWIILRPALVIGTAAYGGTALLRASAAFPLVGIKVYPEAQVQTVSLDDVAEAVRRAALREIPSGTVADLCEADAHDFFEIVTSVRQWLGFPRWSFSFRLPGLLASMLGCLADIAGALGWRSPLRTTALKALREGITGNSESWIASGGRPCRDLSETLASMPASMQERWFAKLYLLLPVIVLGLSLFWIVSGVIGFAFLEKAASVLTTRGLSSSLSQIAVAAGSLVDIGLGLMILFRRRAQQACFGMAAVSLAYLVGGTLLSAELWLDPLGPFVKVVPALLLALCTAAILEER